MKKHTLLVIVILFLLCSCTKNLPDQNGTQYNISQTATAIIQKEYKIFWSTSVPKQLRENPENTIEVSTPEEADVSISEVKEELTGSTVSLFTRIYTVVVPFPTITDQLSIVDLKRIWSGSTTPADEFTAIFLTEDTLCVMRAFWGEPDQAVITVVEDNSLVDNLWSVKNAIAIIPFERIEPKLKVVKVNGLSPMDRPLDEEKYSLTITYSINVKNDTDGALRNIAEQISENIPKTNRDESKMTVVIMTGTTAITRVTTTKVEINGHEYPGSLVKPWFDGADIRHVSNEVSFWNECPELSPVTMRFCSKADQIKVLEYLGVNVIESTGNHLNDYGSENFATTLEMYKERGWQNYGGGLNQADGQTPITMENNGNKIAFIGCNSVGFATGWATETTPGAAKCDYEYYNEQIANLKSQGYIVIATFQYQEIDATMYDEYYRKVFKDAATSGADIVQGSQSHVPMGFDFVGQTLIHYGLGNFIFDQMEPVNLPGFVDRHIIYDGEYINTELLTTKMMNWSRPTPMTEEERADLLAEIFKASRLRK